MVNQSGSWRIMAGMMVGLIGTSWILNALGSTPFMTVTWTQHLMMGSFLFAMAFMATDPVTASYYQYRKVDIWYFDRVYRIDNQSDEPCLS
jgi:Na+-transporting NADH:ubiquinone oxidoreductase subunit B